MSVGWAIVFTGIGVVIGVVAILAFLGYMEGPGSDDHWPI